MDWIKYRGEVDARELQARVDCPEPCELSYTGEFSRDGWTSSTGKNLTDGELWEFVTKYKYMSKLSNVFAHDGMSLPGYVTSKLDSCLELGCDWGHCFDVFENFFHHVYGIEAMESTALMGQELGHNIVHGVMECIPYIGETFDVIMSNHVLEHSLDANLVVSEIARVTHPGGWSVHTTPCRLDGVVEQESEIHKSNITPSEWMGIFVANGFDIIRDYFSWNGNQEEWNLIARKTPTELTLLYETTFGVTAIDIERLESIQNLVRKVENIDGDIAECGVWRGGSAYWVLSSTSKHVDLFDSFQGVPEPTEKDLLDDGSPMGAPVGSFCCGTDDVDKFLSKFSGRYSLHPGWFGDVLSDLPDKKFALVHLDVDHYNSYKECLEYFVPKISKGGYLICDDYGFTMLPGATKAINEFFGGIDSVDHYQVGGQLVVRM